MLRTLGLFLLVFSLLSLFVHLDGMSRCFGTGSLACFNSPNPLDIPECGESLSGSGLATDLLQGRLDGRARSRGVKR
jgi:hypothetical protein